MPHIVMSLNQHRHVLAAALLLIGCLGTGSLLAREHEEEGERVAPVRHALTAKECGECHMAFQPAFLPAGSWNKMMDNLKDHFGDDASLPADKTAEIRAYLTDNAGRHGDPSLIRISEQHWFVREHRREMKPEVLSRPEIKSISNCVACHRDAERGWYEED